MSNQQQVQFFSVFEHKESQKRIFFPWREYPPKEIQSMIRFRRRCKIACDQIEFNKFLTLTYSQKYVKSASSADIREFFNRVKTYERKRNKVKGISRNISYIWRAEFGEKNGRVHFHALVRSRYIHNSVIRNWWKRGYTKYKGIRNKDHASFYVAKYVGKVSGISNLFYTGRRFGTSRDIPPTPGSEWKYIDYFAEHRLVEVVNQHNQNLIPYNLEQYL